MVGEIADDFINARMWYPHLDLCDAYEAYMASLATAAIADFERRLPVTAEVLPRNMPRGLRAEIRETFRDDPSLALKRLCGWLRAISPDRAEIALRQIEEYPEWRKKRSAKNRRNKRAKSLRKRKKLKQQRVVKRKAALRYQRAAERDNLTND